MEKKSLKIGNLTAIVPVIQGGMGVGVSLSNLAGAVAANGGIGIISTAQIGFREPDFHTNSFEANFRAIHKEVKKARELANGGIVGVNIMVATQRYEDYVKEAVKANVDLIISGAGLPVDLPKFVEGSDVKIAPIVSSVKAASLMCRMWEKKYQKIPDFIVIEGPLAGGHLGFSKEELQTITSEQYDEEIKKIISFVKDYADKHQTEIPVIVAGGVFEKEDMEHMMALGADGVQVATRFVTTYECDASQAYKDAYLQAKKEDICIVQSPVGMPGRAVKNAFMERASKERIPIQKCHHCITTCNPAKIPYCITDALIHAVEGDLDNGLIFCGANAWKCQKMETVKEVMEDFR